MFDMLFFLCVVFKVGMLGKKFFFDVCDGILVGNDFYFYERLFYVESCIVKVSIWKFLLFLDDLEFSFKVLILGGMKKMIILLCFF